MSISTANSSISYVGNNSTSTPYVVNYPFFDASDLKVYSVTSGTSTLLALTTNYTVTGGNGSTGSVTTTAAIPATSTVIISRDVPYTQLTSLTTGDRLPAATIEKALDKVTMQAQQLSRNTLPDTAATTGAAPYVLSINSAGASPSWVAQGNAGIADGSITTAKIANGAVTAAKIDPSAKIGGATGAGTDRTFYENDQSVNTNYTISTGKNAMSAGPITVSSGVTVTVPSGSNWSIV